MRIIIDTETHRIIVPNTFYAQIDKLNDLLKANGGEKIEYLEYIKKEFGTAFAQPVVRQSDVTKPRK